MDNKIIPHLECVLREMGFAINTHRFPYTYHHDYIRTYDISRADIAIKLRELCENDDEQYDNAACYVAMLYLIKEQPELINCNLCMLLDDFKESSVYNDLPVDYILSMVV